MTKLGANSFDQVYRIMENAFPEEERRSYGGQLALFDRPDYQMFGLYEDGNLLAFAAGYELETFRFGEHLAADEKLRGSGVGRILFQEYLHSSSKPVVFEVEPPENEIAVRRIAFYERMGCTLYPQIPYVQPPFHTGLEPLPLLLMSWGQVYTQEELAGMVKQIYKDIYHWQPVDKTDAADRMELHVGYEKEDPLRAALNCLGGKVFGLDLEPWYQAGFWDSRSVPYTLFDAGKAVANVIALHFDIRYAGKTRHYVQVSTVMTDPDYRNQGLLRQVMEQMLRREGAGADCVYLHANDGVLDFYPRFGFASQNEYEYYRTVEEITVCADDASERALRRLDIDCEADLRLLADMCSLGNPCSAVHIVDRPEMTLFHAMVDQKEHFYYSERLNLVIAAVREGDCLYCMDVFGNSNVSLDEVLKETAGIHENTPEEGCAEHECIEGAHVLSIVSTGKVLREIRLGFVPADQSSWECRKLAEKDNTLFVLEKGDNLWDSRLRMPELCKA